MLNRDLKMRVEELEKEVESLSVDYAKMRQRFLRLDARLKAEDRWGKRPTGLTERSTTPTSESISAGSGPKNESLS